MRRVTSARPNAICKRKQDLLAQNFISPAELDTAKAKAASLVESANVARAQVDVARAQVQNAQAIVKQREAQLQQARVDLERTQIRSPVDGIVIKRSIEVGQTVAASLQAPELFVIARNLSDMQVEAAIDEADISRVRDGQKVSFTIDAFPGRSFDGDVRQVRKAAVSAQNVVSYTVVVGFANPGSLMLPGMTANVRIITDSRDERAQGAQRRAARAHRRRRARSPAGVGAVGVGTARGSRGRLGLAERAWRKAHRVSRARCASGWSKACSSTRRSRAKLDWRAVRHACRLHGAARLSRSAARGRARPTDGRVASAHQCLPDARAARRLRQAAGAGGHGAC